MSFAGDSIEKVTRTFGSLHTLRDDDGEAYGFDGTTHTPLGAVQVHAQVFRDRDQILVLSTQVGPRRFWRRQVRPPSRHVTKRGAATVAHRWMAELAVEGRITGWEADR